MQNELSQYKDAISQAMESFFLDLPESFNLKLSEHSKSALDVLREYSTRPSKRIRGSLAAYSYDYASGSHFAEAGIQAGVALELMQNYLLIVDDVTDKSDYRRGQPTVHKLYERSSAVSKSDTHIANMMAINVGLLSQHLVNIVMSQIKERPENVNQAMLVMHKNISATAYGQIDDILQQVGQDLDETDILNKYELKSSYYTFVNPIQVGLVLAGLNDEQKLDEVRRFGVAAGIAFQLHDDVLGIFGDAAVTGKSNADDIKEGKYTLMVQHALANADQQDGEALRAMLGSQDLSDSEFEQVKEIFTKYGSKEYVEQKAIKYSDAALGYLDQATVWNDAAKSMLRQLVEYVTKREK